eukprot:8382359-Prorocentrum_lima.AAC.1
MNYGQAHSPLTTLPPLSTNLAPLPPPLVIIMGELPTPTTCGVSVTPGLSGRVGLIGRTLAQ